MVSKLDPDWPVFALDSDELKYELLTEMIPNTDTEGREYEMITQCLADDDFYQGLNMVSVIRRKGDGKLFGFFWWDDISKYGELYMEENGDEYGIEQPKDTDRDDFDWDNDWIHYYVFEPVEYHPITSYKPITDRKNNE